MNLPSSVPADVLVSIWSELVEAYHGVNSFGGTVAEIYAYRFMRFDPQVLHPRAVDSAMKAMADEAGESLVAIVRKFSVDWKCRIEMDGLDVNSWHARGGYGHRCHIEVFSS